MLETGGRMNFKEITAQIFGIIGLVLTAWSYQEKSNKKFFIKQGLAGLMFCINFFLIGAISAALFNITNLVRGSLLSKNDYKSWRIILIEFLYTVCFLFALSTIIGNPFQIFLSSLTFVALAMMSVFMWQGNGKYIRYAQFFFVSPAWIIHNVFNFSLGGLLCEIFCMLSVVISFIRYGKDGFENERVIKGER